MSSRHSPAPFPERLISNLLLCNASVPRLVFYAVYGDCYILLMSNCSQRAERAVLRKVETEVLKLRDDLEAKGLDEASFFLSFPFLIVFHFFFFVRSPALHAVCVHGTW